MDVDESKGVKRPLEDGEQPDAKRARIEPNGQDDASKAVKDSPSSVNPNPLQYVPTSINIRADFIKSSNLFNDPDFNDYKVFVRVEDQAAEERIFHVTKLMLVQQSAYFLERIRQSKEGLHVTLKAGTNMTHFEDLIRWVYTGAFETADSELMNVAHLAIEFKMEKALEALLKRLTQDMTIAKACALLVSAGKPQTEQQTEQSQSLRSLSDAATKYILFSFMDLETSSATAWANLPVEAVRVVLGSSALRVGCENAVFAAYRAWVHADFENRKQHAVTLLPLIRFPLLQRNYLMDVVRTEADREYSDEVKKLFAKRLIECYTYHTSNDARRDLLGEPKPEPRRYDSSLMTGHHSLIVEKVSEQREKWSEPFIVAGYTFALLFQRKQVDQPDGGTIGVYLHLKTGPTGLCPKFFLPIAFEITVRNRLTNKYLSPKGVYQTPFTAQNKAWGYVDLLGMKWVDFLKASSPFRLDSDDTLSLKVNVGLGDLTPQQLAPPPPPAMVAQPPPVLAQSINSTPNGASARPPTQTSPPGRSQPLPALSIQVPKQ